MLDGITVAAGCVLVVLSWSSVLSTVFATGRPSRAAAWSVRLVAAGCAVLARWSPKARRERLRAAAGPLALFAGFGFWTLAAVTGFVLIGVGVGAVTGADGVVRLVSLRLDGEAALLGPLVWLSTALLVAVFAVHLMRVTAAIARRERLVVRLSAHATRSDDAEWLIAAHVSTGSRRELDAWFAEWANWLADVRATHTAQPALVHIRSADPLCWLEAVVIVLDTAALLEAVAPGWSPPHARVVLDAGEDAFCEIADDLGVALPRPAVSLHGREQRGFAETLRLITDTGLPVERDQQSAWVVVQAERTRYAPHIAAAAAHLGHDHLEHQEIRLLPPMARRLDSCGTTRP
jgi:hypothetical protein